MALLATACGHDKQENGAVVHNVYVVTPDDDARGTSRVFAGVVEENSEISLGFKTAGELAHINVKEGQHVAKGQLMASLDDSDYQLGVEALQIQYDQLKDEVERAGRLFEKKSMSANDYEKALAGLRQLGVQLQVNKNKLAYTRLYAPCPGVVESVNFSAGEMVDAGTAVFTVLDVSRKAVVVDIPASVYLRRDDICGATCTISHSAASHPMEVLSIVPKADSNQLYRMKLGFSGAAPEVTPGMNVEVTLEFRAEGDGSLRIPQSALMRKDGKDFVWILNPDSTVTMRRVEINPSGARAEVEVVSGLEPDTKVVRAGVRMLHEGEKVRVIGQPSETNYGGML